MPHATAKVNGTVIADADSYEVVEGNIYFPPSSIVDKSMLTDSTASSNCPWKGKAAYYNINVNGDTLKDSAWYYPHPKDHRAEHIKNFIAFYKTKVQIESD